MSILPERNNAQFQPITTVLRNIIRDYQAGGGVLLELCQNADDAGASKVEFVLDSTQHQKDNILHKGLAQYQGVALLAYNNRPFEEKDFESLSRIGDSGKQDDLNATGKFGRGFNSVYNWTDSPSILSGTSLLILDPHHTWSATPEVGHPGGPVYDFKKHSHQPKMRNQLSAFSSLLPRFDTEFDGTIIRLPLRTTEQAARSMIVKGKHTSKEDVVEVFKTFANGLVGSLLFLKNVNSITLRIDGKVYAKATSEFNKTSPVPPLSTPAAAPSSSSGPQATPLSASARKRRNKQNKHKDKAEVNANYQRVYVDKIDPEGKKNFVMKISLQDKDHPPGKELQYTYAVSHIQGQGPADAKLLAWATKNKLFPWTAIAAPLEGYSSEQFHGSLFSTLPLPIPTNHPVHIHGMFSVTPDRLRLHVGGAWTTATHDSEVQFGAKWNAWLFSSCIPQTWIQNLAFLQLLHERGECRFTAWNFWPMGSNEEWAGRGMRVLGDVFKGVVEGRLKLLPTICGTAGSRGDVFFSLEQLPGDGETALREAGIAVVLVPGNRYYELGLLKPDELGLTPLTPQGVRGQLEGKRLDGLSLNSKMQLLQYIIEDAYMNTLNIGQCTAPLIPVVGGTYEGFHNSGQADPVFLARDEDEAELFSEHTRVVDTANLLPETVYALRSNLDLYHYPQTQISKWTVFDAAQYCAQYVFADEDRSEDILWRDEDLEFVDRLWQWVRKNEPPAFSNTIFKSPLGRLWLLPLMDGGYVRLNSHVLVIDVSRSGEIGAFLLKTARKYGVKYPIYTGEGLSAETGDYLKRCPGLLKDVEKGEYLVPWLAANQEFMDRWDSQERVHLVRHFAVLAERCITTTRITAMRNHVAKFKIFKEAKLQGQPRAWISMVDAEGNHRQNTYIGVKNIEVSLQSSGKTFIDIDDTDTARLVTLLGLATCPSLMEIFEYFVVPEITNTSDAQRRTMLVDYALQNFRSLPPGAMDELSNANFVPVSGPTGIILKRPSETFEAGSPVGSLYFQDEYRVTPQSLSGPYRNQLLQLGMVDKLTEDVVLERIKEYGKPERALTPQEVAEKARQLLSMCTNPPPIPEDLLQLRWLPARFQKGAERLQSPRECRSARYESLVNYTMGIVDFQVSLPWANRLGWNRTLSKPLILQQVKGAVDADDFTALGMLVKEKVISAEQFHKELTEMDWIPSVDGRYYTPGKIYLDDITALSPHFGTLDRRFQKYAQSLFTKIGVKKGPSFQQLKELQDKFAEKKVLEQPELDMSLYIVKEVGKIYSEKAGHDLNTFKAPDRSGRMCPISELTFGNPGTSRTNLKILHPGIALDTVKQLDVAMFEDRYLELLNDTHYEAEISQEDSLKAIIEDVLGRYDVKSTFTQFLANAEDCGEAQDVRWILDVEEGYSRVGLLSVGLAEMQGPALFCYNDGHFSERDFNEITKFGLGTKNNNSDKIGKYGEGVMTMFHWTWVPSFISGNYFVIFDPEQKYLPEHPDTNKPRAAMKLEIGKLRAQWPEQLRPFEGIMGFDKNSTSFPGTLFRFPFAPPSETKEKIGILEARKPEVRKLGIPEAKKLLEAYYEEANISLLFLNRITSLSFWNKGEKQANWSVQVKADSTTTEERGVLHLTINGQYDDSAKLKKHESVCREWCVISGRLDTASIPKSLSRVPGKGRLDAKYGLAALISESLQGFFSRHFVGPPLKASDLPGLPVHVNADIMLKSDRKGLVIKHGEDGAEWNRAFLETSVASLYLELVQYLMGVSGAGGYKYWPEYSQRRAESVSKILAKAFWEGVATSTYSLYPPNTPSDKHTSGNEHTSKLLRLNEATFNLFSIEPQRDFFSSLLLRLGSKDIVTPVETVRNGLSMTQPGSMKWITPKFLVDEFRGSPTKSDKLREIWGQDYNYSIGYFDFLLSFITEQSTLPLLPGCALLPLADDTLGMFRPRSAEQVYLVAGDVEEHEVLEISKNRMVHPGLESSVVESLISCGLLNIRRLQFDDVGVLYLTLDTEGREGQYRKDWLVKVWTYLRVSIRDSPGTEDTHLFRLRDMGIYIGKAVGEDEENYTFICPSEFDAFTHPAILEPSEATSDETAVIKSLKGLILLDRLAFPASRMRQESIRDAAGVYRLLKSIELLASREGSSITGYIKDNVHPDSLSALRKIFSPPILDELLNLERYPEVKGYLRQLPLWPSADQNPTIHRPVTEALLPPYASLSSSGMTSNDIFISSTVAKRYSDQLIQLDVAKMTLDEFLKEHVGVSPNREISADKIPYYEALIDNLGKSCQHAFTEYPLGVDGNKKFRMLSSLYCTQEQIFVAAFRESSMSHFLYEEFRHFPAWGLSPLIRAISEESYLACARLIQGREIESQNQEDFLTDARTVFEYLCYDYPERQEWSPATWEDIFGIGFAPIMTGSSGNPSHRHQQMERLLGGRKLTAIKDAVSPEYIAIAWSQSPVLETRLLPKVLEKLPTRGIPSVNTVLNHLKFLSKHRGNVTDKHIQQYVRDIVEVYKWVQKNLKSFDQSPISPGDDIWFNADTSNIPEMTIDEFQKSWICSQDLCIGLEYDSPSHSKVRSFLTPYTEFMQRCGVKRIKTLIIPQSLRRAITTDHTSLLLSGLQRLREEGKSLDVQIILGDRVFDAHCAVLCAVSGYWKQWSSSIGEPSKIYKFPADTKVKPKSVLALLDYIYTGKVPSTERTENFPENLDDVLDQLYLSHDWELEELKAELEFSLRDKYWIRPECVRTILQCAEKVGAQGLVEICNQYISGIVEISG